MKPVTLQTVNARIDELAAIQANTTIGISLREEFELQCMRKLSELLALRERAEPFGWTDEQELRDVNERGCGYLFTVNPITAHADPRRVIKLYAEPPAPVVIDALAQFAEFMAAESIKVGDYPDGWQCKAANAAHEYAQSCRAATLAAPGKN
ncbi:hypothetical protein [Cronobacter dublinensis]|uniref:hypothetical protein n=1 Tax=Cronobacter dublinensis TaxID=413497 RepID=UPI000CFB7D71|nr:hypothetical protein [Cronobacter dublinensis]